MRHGSHGRLGALDRVSAAFIASAIASVVLPSVGTALAAPATAHTVNPPAHPAPAVPHAIATESSKIDPAKVEIDKIEIEGVSVFDSTRVESALEIGVGSRLDKNRVARTRSNLLALYRLHGYEDADLGVELFREKIGASKNEGARFDNVLRFRIKEGKPTRIASVRIVSDSTHSEALAEYWRRNAKSIEAKTGLSPRDVLDQERILSSKRTLQDALAAEEFIGARVGDAKVFPDAEPPDLTAGTLNSAARWVSIEFKVDLGERVTFGFRGNTIFTKSKLESFVDEQRLLGFGKDYIESARLRIEEEYRAEGYAHTRVIAYPFEAGISVAGSTARHVTYDIDEGERVEIGSLTFDGNSVFTEGELTRQFYTDASSLLQGRYYVQKDVEKSADLLIEWMKSQGFLGAKRITIKVNDSSDFRRVNLIVYLYEGDQTMIRTLKLPGLTALKSSEAAALLGVQEGAPLNLFAFSKGVENLKAAYRDRGYLDIKLLNEGMATVVTYSDENRRADIQLDVQEGPQFRASKITVEGEGKTRPEVALREVQFSEGDVLSAHLITESEARLRKLLIFSAVALRMEDDPARPGYKNVVVSVQEGAPGILAGGVGYRNDLGVRVFGQYEYTNLWHRNHTFAFNANVNRRFDADFCSKLEARQKAGVAPSGETCFLEYQFQLGYTWPWFGLEELTFQPKLTFERTQYNTLDTDTLALTGNWERRLVKSIDLVGDLTYSLERTKQYNAVAAVDNRTLTIGALIPGLRLDLRDDKLAPTSGAYFSGSYEFASPALLSQSQPVPVGYERFIFRSDFFIPLFKNVTWYWSFRTGVERNREIAPPGTPPEIATQYAIPLSKQFTLGGAGSLRGFGEQEIFRDLAISGTLNYVNYRTQLDLPFSGPLRFGPFIDAGNLLVDHYSFGELRYGAGVGFHYQSPVGPINFDWGFNLFPQTGEDPYHFYFSIGVI